MDIRRQIQARVQEVQEHLASADLSISERAISQLVEYVEYLERWTSRVDLVSQKSGLDMVDPHIIDSIAALEVWRRSDFVLPNQLCDVGSGAGLPGIVWAILRPELEFVLLEPRKKRIDFLSEVRRKLRLENVRLIAQRSDTLDTSLFAKQEEPAAFVCRALGMEPEFLAFARRISEKESLPGSQAIILAGPNWRYSEEHRLANNPVPTCIDYSLFREGPQRKLVIWSV